MNQPAPVAATKDKRRIVLLIAALLGTLYAVYIIQYFFGLNTQTDADTATQAGSAIATALVAPHMICVLLAAIFGWLAWALRGAGFALVAGILYCVGGVLFIVYFPFVLVQMILSFIGYSKSKKAKKS